MKDAEYDVIEAALKAHVRGMISKIESALGYFVYNKDNVMGCFSIRGTEFYLDIPARYVQDSLREAREYYEKLLDGTEAPQVINLLKSSPGWEDVARALAVGEYYV
jgi:hypothetical protein